MIYLVSSPLKSPLILILLQTKKQNTKSTKLLIHHKRVLSRHFRRANVKTLQKRDKDAQVSPVKCNTHTHTHIERERDACGIETTFSQNPRRSRGGGSSSPRVKGTNFLIFTISAIISLICSHVPTANQYFCPVLMPDKTKASEFKWRVIFIMAYCVRSRLISLVWLVSRFLDDGR